MLVKEFAEAIAKVGRQYGGSVSSWGRTGKRAVAVGGFAGDPHTWWLGADMTYDDGANRPGSNGHRRSPQSCPQCASDGLKVIHEKTHDHYQPADFPAGPVTKYPQETK